MCSERLTISKCITRLIDTLVHRDTTAGGNGPAGVLVHFLGKAPRGEDDVVAGVRKVASNNLPTTISFRAEDEALADTSRGEGEGRRVDLV